MGNIRDISDKGRKPTKNCKYEILMYVKPNPDVSDETPELVAKFKAYGDALNFAMQLSKAPDPTMVLLRS